MIRNRIFLQMNNHLLKHRFYLLPTVTRYEGIQSTSYENRYPLNQKRYMTSDKQQNNSSPVSYRYGRQPLSDLYFPQSLDEECQFLMEWKNIENNPFLKDLRKSFLKYGNKLTDKQFTALTNSISAIVKEDGRRKQMYPKILSIDPIFKQLLTLTDDDISFIGGENEKTKELIIDLKKNLLERGALTCKQLNAAGNIFMQYFPDREENIPVFRKDYCPPTSVEK